jgi:hypothetical protein
MTGFFGFGPVGAIAGALLGAGLALTFGPLASKWGIRLIVSGGVVFGIGGVVLLVAGTPDRGPSYSEVIEFELEYPAKALEPLEIPSSNAMWGAAGGKSDDTPISQFFEKKCSGDVCVVNGSVAALGDMDNFRITTKIGPARASYPLDVPAPVTAPVDWSAWRSREGVRWRWRIVKH